MRCLGRRVAVAGCFALATGVIAARIAFSVVHFAHDDSRRAYLGVNGWPSAGQSAYVLTGQTARSSSSGTRPVPIASLAKVMTAMLVLQSAPLPTGSNGFHVTLTSHDVDDLNRRRARDETTVAVQDGEVLDERDALQALLLPSANNIAVILARHLSGSVQGFVARMNSTAARLGMKHTRYTDPSGFDDGTRSTAKDQLILAQAAMRSPVFAAIVRTRSAYVPVAGTVENTDTLLGHDGFVGMKTGSDDAAGGCFMFRTYRVVDGHTLAVTGVVLGQPGSNLVLTGQYAASQLVDRVIADRRRLDS